MKHFRLIAGTTLVLFIIGLLSGSFLLKLTEKILGKEVIGLSLWSSFIPKLSFGFLLVFCSLCAGGFVWAYSKVSSSATKSVFGLGLFLSIASAIIGIGWKLLQLRFVFNSSGNVLDDSSLSSESINYFSWGFGLTFFINAIIIVILLLVSRQRQQQKDSNISVSSN